MAATLPAATSTCLDHHGSAGSTLPVAQHKHVAAVFLAGYSKVRPIFDAYRKNYLKLHGKHAPLDRLAYCGLIYVGDDEKARTRCQ